MIDLSFQINVWGVLWMKKLLSTSEVGTNKKKRLLGLFLKKEGTVAQPVPMLCLLLSCGQSEGILVSVV